jgi:hypothetical protein
MVDVAQWQSIALWMRWLWVRAPSSTPKNKAFSFVPESEIQIKKSLGLSILKSLSYGQEVTEN